MGALRSNDLGIVRQRAAEWALVKFANQEVDDVSEGSALVAINGASTQLQPYQAS